MKTKTRKTKKAKKQPANYAYAEYVSNLADNYFGEYLDNDEYQNIYELCEEFIVEEFLACPPSDLVAAVHENFWYIFHKNPAIENALEELEKDLKKLYGELY